MLCYEAVTDSFVRSRGLCQGHREHQTILCVGTREDRSRLHSLLSNPVERAALEVDFCETEMTRRLFRIPLSVHVFDAVCCEAFGSPIWGRKRS